MFNPICFKCGSPGHVARLCEEGSFQCLIPTCNSRTHNSEAHTAMEKAGKVVLPDRTPVASAVTPQGKEVSLTEAQIAQAKKNNNNNKPLKNKKKKRGEK